MLNKVVSDKQDQQLSQIYRQYKYLSKQPRIANDDRFTYYNLYRTMEVYIKQYTNCCQELDGNPRVKNNNSIQLQRACRSLVEHINQIGQQVKMTGLAELSLTYLHLGQMIQDFTRKFIRLNEKIIHRFYQHRFSLIYGQSNKASVRNSRRCSQNIKIQQRQFDYIKQVQKNMFQQIQNKQTQKILNQSYQKQQSVKSSKKCSQDQDDFHRLSSFSRVIMAKDAKEISERSQLFDDNNIILRKKRRYTICRIIEDQQQKISNGRKIDELRPKRNKTWVSKDKKIIEDMESEKEKSSSSQNQAKKLQKICELQEQIKIKDETIALLAQKVKEMEKKFDESKDKYALQTKQYQQKINKLTKEITNANRCAHLMQLMCKANMNTIPPEQSVSLSPEGTNNKYRQTIHKLNIKTKNIQPPLVSASESLQNLQIKLKQSNILFKNPNKQNFKGYIMPKCLKKKSSDPLSKSLSNRFNFMKPILLVSEERNEEKYNFSNMQKQKIHEEKSKSKKRFINTQINNEDIDVYTNQPFCLPKSPQPMSRKSNLNVKNKKLSVKNLFPFFKTD